VIAGTAGGLRLEYPKEVKIRPTADRVREAIFNILAGQVDDARVLDLYAGTGAFGIEALSRGAAHCLFIEKHRGCIAAINENLRKTGFTDRATVIAFNASRFPGSMEIREPFDIVFLDPPYRISQNCETGSEIAQLMQRIHSHGLLAPGGIIVLEHASNAVVPDALGLLAVSDRRDYGSTGVTFIRQK